MTRNSFKYDLLLTKLFFVTILCMPLGVLCIEHSFESVYPLVFVGVGTAILALPAIAILVRGYFEWKAMNKK